MGRGKLENRLMENRSSRRDSFNKRNKGILKKAYELAFISGCGIHVILEAEDGNVYEFHRQMSAEMQQAMEGPIIGGGGGGGVVWKAPSNKRMFFNGLKIMETGMFVSPEERAAMRDPVACGCFDCVKGFSSRRIDTISPTPSVNPYEGDFRSPEEIEMAVRQRPLLVPPLDHLALAWAPYPADLLPPRPAPPPPLPRFGGYGPLCLPPLINVNFTPASTAPPPPPPPISDSNHQAALAAPDQQLPSTSDQFPMSTVTNTSAPASAPTSDDDIKDSTLCSSKDDDDIPHEYKSHICMEGLEAIAPLNISEVPHVQASDDFMNFFECSGKITESIPSYLDGVDFYRFEDFNTYQTLELPFDDVNDHSSLDNIII